MSQYTELLEGSRRHAIDRMVDNARLLSADAIGMRLDSSEIDSSLTEVVAYGTGVVVEDGARRRRPGQRAGAQTDDQSSGGPER